MYAGLCMLGVRALCSADAMAVVMKWIEYSWTLVILPVAAAVRCRERE